MFQVLELVLSSGQPPVVLEEADSFLSALAVVATSVVNPKKGELRPLVNHAVAALKPYKTLQSWEVRLKGERIALLAISEVEE